LIYGGIDGRASSNAVAKLKLRLTKVVKSNRYCNLSGVILLQADELHFFMTYFLGFSKAYRLVTNTNYHP
jgi:hypothetical protein